MITMAPPRPPVSQPPRQTELHGCQVRLPAEPATAGEARDHVRAVLAAWDVPVDADIAVLLASDLVTNAILHQADGTITLVITSSPGQLRVDVYGTACHLPPRGPLPAEVETGPRPGPRQHPGRSVGLVPHPDGPGRLLHPGVPARTLNSRVAGLRPVPYT